MKKHYHLCTATILFLAEGQHEGSILVNCVPRLDSQTIRRVDLDHATLLAQQVFMAQVPEEQRPAVQILQVVFNNFSYLGEMTEEEFMFRPEPTVGTVANG